MRNAPSNEIKIDVYSYTPAIVHDVELANKLASGAYSLLLIASTFNVDEQLVPGIATYVNSKSGRETAKSYAKEAMPSNAINRGTGYFCSDCGRANHQVIEPPEILEPADYIHGGGALPDALREIPKLWDAPEQAGEKLFEYSPDIAWLIGNAPSDVRFDFAAILPSSYYMSMVRYTKAQAYNLDAQTYNLDFERENWSGTFVKLEALKAYNHHTLEQLIQGSVLGHVAMLGLEEDHSSVAVLGYNFYNDPSYAPSRQRFQDELARGGAVVTVKRLPEEGEKLRPSSECLAKIFSRIVTSGLAALPEIALQIPERELLAEATAHIVTVVLDSLCPLDRSVYYDTLDRHLLRFRQDSELTDSVINSFERACREHDGEDIGFARAKQQQLLEKLLGQDSGLGCL